MHVKAGILSQSSSSSIKWGVRAYSTNHKRMTHVEDLSLVYFPIGGDAAPGNFIEDGVPQHGEHCVPHVFST